LLQVTKLSENDILKQSGKIVKRIRKKGENLPGINVRANVMEEVVDEDGLVQAVLNDVVPQLSVIVLWRKKKSYKKDMKKNTLHV
jgi:hypothetical protein